MSTPPDPTGRLSAAQRAAPATPSNDRPAGEQPAGQLPLPPANGSTGSHVPNHSLSDLIHKGGSAHRQSAESDIAQFLAHPQGGGANTDDAPTVITQNKPGGTLAPAPAPTPITVPSEPPSIAGRRLGHFELIEAIGAGGMAAVLKARDLELGRVVALKILPPEAARDPESVNRFKQEGRAAAKLDHDNVARVYFCGEDQGLHFIAFEFVEGDNLRVLIDRRGPLTAAECVPYMMQVAAGLNHAAERGVVHRDIKPSNILITPDGRAKIVDMGLARYLDADVNGGVTQSGVTLGTFDYISPEQALDPRRADVRSDIYSLGCTFYHALTGRPPVPEGTAARKLRAHQNELPLDPRELNPAVPDELAAVLARMMAKVPADRYQTPTELIAHLKGLAERLHLRADPLANDSATKSVPADMYLLPEAPRVRPWWVLAVAVVALAAVAFVVATSNPGPAPGLPGGSDQAKEKGGDAPFVPDKSGPTTRPNPPAAGVVTTVEALVARLEGASATGKVVVHLAAGDFDLSDKPPVAFKGETLELVGAPIGAPGGGTKLILAADSKPGERGSLALKATKSLTIRNVWFDLKLAPNTPDDPSPLFGLQLDDAAHVRLEDCVFAASDKNLESHFPRSVVIARAAGAPRLDVLRCLFAPGTAGVGMIVPAGTTVAVTDSGFAPHATGMLIEWSPAPGGSDLPPLTDVLLEHSSFMLDPGESVVETTVPANVKVTAADCVFAQAGGPPFRPMSASSAAASRGVVIRVDGDKAENVSVQSPTGHTNAFYGVDPVGTRKETVTVTADDKGHVELNQRPWASDADLLATVASKSPWKAFRIKALGADADDALLTKDKSPKPLGAAFHQSDYNNVRLAYADVVWGNFSRPKTAEVQQKVWYPKALDNQRAPGVYRNLSDLFDDVRPGDTVLIRHTGELPRDTFELKALTKPGDGEFKVTFRPEAGSRPVLTINKDAQADQTLFKLLGGEVTFENIHFRLQPDQPKAGQTVAAIAMLGGKKATFTNCVFTLAEEGDSKVAAVHLPDIGRAMVMMKPESRQAPKVTFTNCLIRGRGRGVWVGASRPVNLEVTNTLTAVDGPVFFAEAGGEAVVGTSSAKFIHVTALAGGPLVEMHGKPADAKAAGLVKLEVETDRCLFVAVKDAGRPLVELDGVDPADWKTVLGWQVKEGNRYANFDASADLAVIRSGGEGMEKRWTHSDWIDNIGEPLAAEKRFGAIVFAAPTPALTELAGVKPADVTAQTVDFADLTDLKALDTGADLSEWKKKPLPLPLPDDSKPE